ncbi:ATP cone domain-containing protein [Sphingobacterium pedocola]|uniref:Restriction endonuclease n=1 Tax=Sphingobacterium pedocola TaxID=2082722 RepID=A0ABR9T7D3_9SPHI|nr:ATP cone domain-containing protein [Sphingobacterium pedocola]MBE8720577.1 restriction endonuclease [Sphingobacterium pedocola]
MQIKKNSGELVAFDPDSLRNSLSRSGANDDEVEKVFKAIDNELYNGISTKKLYQLAFDFLKNLRESYAARYSLKNALRELGPEGFYFEKWIGRLFQEDGYQTVTGQTLQGHAVTHEIDVVALRNENLLAVECKFRNDTNAKISVTTPMYFMSRLKDISGITYNFFNKEHEITQGWLVTNAHLTSDSIRFGEYYKLNLLSWDYPKESSIKARVDSNGEYPITCLTTLNQKDKVSLLKNQCILVKDIVRNPDFLEYIQAIDAKKKQILLEAHELIDSQLGH